MEAKVRDSVPDSTEPRASTRDKPLMRTVPAKAAGQRVLHVNVPSRIFELAKAKALMLGMSWPEFVVHLLTVATTDLAADLPLDALQCLSR